MDRQTRKFVTKYEQAGELQSSKHSSRGRTAGNVKYLESIIKNQLPSPFRDEDMKPVPVTKDVLTSKIQTKIRRIEHAEATRMGARTAQGQARQTIRLATMNPADDKESHGNDFHHYSLLASEYDNTTEYAKIKHLRGEPRQAHYKGIYNNGQRVLF